MIILFQTKIEMLKLYDNCLIFILEKNISIDRLPTAIQNDIFALRKYYQAKCTDVEKWRAVESESDWNSFWWEDKLENIDYDLACEEYDECLYCNEWKKVEEEKESMDLYLEKLTKELTKAENIVKEVTMKIPTHLSHLTKRVIPVYSWSKQSWTFHFKQNVCLR